MKKIKAGIQTETGFAEAAVAAEQLQTGIHMISDKQGFDRGIVGVSCQVFVRKDSLAGMVTEQRFQPQLCPVFPFHGGVAGVIQDVNAVLCQQDSHGPGAADFYGFVSQLL